MTSLFAYFFYSVDNVRKEGLSYLVLYPPYGAAVATKGQMTAILSSACLAALFATRTTKGQMTAIKKTTWEASSLTKSQAQAHSLSTISYRYSSPAIWFLVSRSHFPYSILCDSQSNNILTSCQL